MRMRAACVQLGCCCVERLSCSAHSRVDHRCAQIHLFFCVCARSRAGQCCWADGHDVLAAAYLGYPCRPACMWATWSPAAAVMRVAGAGHGVVAHGDCWCDSLSGRPCRCPRRCEQTVHTGVSRNFHDYFLRQTSSP